MNIEEQVNLAVKGDEKAFEYLMDISKDSLYRTAFAYVKNEHDALDILQDTVYKAYVSIEKLKDPRVFKTWITRILINNAINFMNKKKKIISLTDTITDEASSPRHSGIEEKLDMLNSIDKLEEKYRNVIVLKYFQDMTITEISEVLNCPAGTVKTYLNKALNKLRLGLNEEMI